MTPFMVDLYAGLGGASAAMRERGWRVVGVDLDAKYRPDIVADVRKLPLRAGLRPDLVWASPPCEEFAKDSMPWFKDTPPPSLELVGAAMRAIEWLQPRWWVIENVRGSHRWIRLLLGPHRARYGPVYLWGDFPLFLLGQRPAAWKERLSSKQDALRAAIPFEISEGLALAVEGTAA